MAHGSWMSVIWIDWIQSVVSRMEAFLVSSPSIPLAKKFLFSDRYRLTRLKVHYSFSFSPQLIMYISGRSHDLDHQSVIIYRVNASLNYMTMETFTDLPWEYLIIFSIILAETSSRLHKFQNTSEYKEFSLELKVFILEKLLPNNWRMNKSCLQQTVSVAIGHRYFW